MTIRTGSFGPMLHGVSQQPKRLMVDGQVRKQENMFSSITRGLTTRPGSTDVSVLANADVGMTYELVETDYRKLVIGSKAGDIRAWELDGTEVTINPVTTFQGDPMTYPDTNMRFWVSGSDIIVVNSDKVVNTASTTGAKPPRTIAYDVVSGAFSRRYRVEFYVNGTNFTASYTTPDGTTAGDANLSRPNYIIGQLKAQLEASFNWPGRAEAYQFGGTLVIRAFNNQGEIIMQNALDDQGGELMRGIGDTVDSPDLLPEFAAHGHTVKVTNSRGVQEDDYYLKYEVPSDPTPDGQAGFGEKGAWVETFLTGETNQFDVTTMPHRLIDNGSVLSFEHCPWLNRPVGDNFSDPFPSLIGKTIRDISGFESRLVLLTYDTLIMSRTNDVYDLWRESATAVIATDSIDLTSTKKNNLKLDWLVPFDRDLIIFSDPGDSQFIIRGGDVTSRNLSMVLSTEYECYSGGTRPVSTGRTILFPFEKGSHSGIQEYYTRDSTSANIADTLTDTVDKYIDGKVTNLKVSTSANAAFVQSEGGNYIYQFLVKGGEQIQSAWHTWNFSDTVLHSFFQDSDLFVIVDSPAGIYLNRVDMNFLDQTVGYHITLDRRTPQSISGNSVILPFDNAKFVQATGCAVPGLEAVPTSTTALSGNRTQYFFDPLVAPVGATVIGGQPITWALEPNSPFGKDHQGRVDTGQEVTVTEYSLHIDKSGKFNAEMSGPYIPTPFIFDPSLYPIDTTPIAVDALGLRTGQFYVPWGERADWSTLTLTGDDIRPVTILEIEWLAQIIRTKGSRI